jgi:P-type E1-E2 ATPase
VQQCLHDQQRAGLTTGTLWALAHSANVCHTIVQGLPATVTSLLSLTALRLRDRQVLIKRTDIIENLGVATIIASDKTGTLTQNRMTVENLWCNLVSAWKLAAAVHANL